MDGTHGEDKNFIKNSVQMTQTGCFQKFDVLCWREKFLGYLHQVDYRESAIRYCCEQSNYMLLLHRQDDFEVMTFVRFTPSINAHTKFKNS